MPIKTIIPIILSLSCVIASPVPSKGKDDHNPKVLYDQHQEGQWNVRANLDNFLIMVVPPQSLSLPGELGFLDFFTKSLKKRTHLRRVAHTKKHKRPDAAQETMHFIESKTAPYRVDITESKSDAKTGDEAEIVASSPEIALITSDVPAVEGKDNNQRVTRHIILTVPAEEEYILTTIPENKSASKKVKKTIKEVTKKEMKLLGAENEQCGPGLARDSYGICRTSVKV